MKTAKEMFEKIGYEYTTYSKDIIFSKEFEYATVELYFDIDTKSLTIQSNKDIAFEFNIKELKAINKQCEELGWITREEE